MTSLISNDFVELAEGSGASPKPTTVPTADRVTYGAIEDFVAHIIYDGRFLDCFTVNPEAVAEELGVNLTPEVVKALQGRDRGEVLAEVTGRMTHEHGERTAHS